MRGMTNAPVSPSAAAAREAARATSGQFGTQPAAESELELVDASPALDPFGDWEAIEEASRTGYARTANQAGWRPVDLTVDEDEHLVVSASYMTSTAALDEAFLDETAAAHGLEYRGVNAYGKVFFTDTADRGGLNAEEITALCESLGHQRTRFPFPGPYDREWVARISPQVAEDFDTPVMPPAGAESPMTLGELAHSSPSRTVGYYDGRDGKPGWHLTFPSGESSTLSWEINARTAQFLTDHWGFADTTIRADRRAKLIEDLTTSASAAERANRADGRSLSYEAGASARRKEKLARTRNKKAWAALAECEQATPEELLERLPIPVSDDTPVYLPGSSAPLSAMEKATYARARQSRYPVVLDDVVRRAPKG